MKKKRVRKRILIPVVLGILVILGAADYSRWLNQVSAMAQPDIGRQDGIVVLTGGSGLRIEAAIDLLERGYGQRLLLSGVNRRVDKEDLINAAGGTEGLYACCIDIDRIAGSTIENARETAKWVKKNDYSSLVIVTSDYHLPRALLLYAERLPDNVEIIGYPVQSGITPKTWWQSWRSFRGHLTEWAKYRVTTIILSV